MKQAYPPVSELLHDQITAIRPRNATIGIILSPAATNRLKQEAGLPPHVCLFSFLGCGLSTVCEKRQALYLATECIVRHKYQIIVIWEEE